MVCFWVKKGVGGIMGCFGHKWVKGCLEGEKGYLVGEKGCFGENRGVWG